MNRLIAYSAAVLAVTIPAVLLARTLIQTDEDGLERIVSNIEQERSNALLDVAAFDQGGLVISAGTTSRRFDAAGVEDARALLEQATGIDSAGRVRLRQQQVRVNDERATALLNVEVGDGSYVGLRLNLTLHDGEWLVDQIRVMG